MGQDLGRRSIVAWAANATASGSGGAFETAASVYGMADAAGGMWDWTGSWFDDRKVLRVLRGGSWNVPPRNLRCTDRFGNLPSVRYSVSGFRCARDL